MLWPCRSLLNSLPPLRAISRSQHSIAFREARHRTRRQGLGDGCLRADFTAGRPHQRDARRVNKANQRPNDGTAAIPLAQYLGPDRAVETMAMFGARRVLNMPPAHIGVLAAYGGALIAAGALFSVLLSGGVETPGPRRLLEGLGFSSGFFFVILSHAILFTEANVVMPVALLHCSAETLIRRAIRFWIVAWVGNFIGALTIGYLVATVQYYPSDIGARLAEIIEGKMAYREIGGVTGWLQVVASGALANWLVGLAALFATMGRTVIDKFIPVFLAVSLFDAASFQHSPANMAFFSLAAGMGVGPGWSAALGWSILPAALGNILGGFLLVVVPFWITFGSKHSDGGSGAQADAR
jgi:formate/nitrite transporter FocA (FNT family)